MNNRMENQQLDATIISGNPFISTPVMFSVTKDANNNVSRIYSTFADYRSAEEIADNTDDTKFGSIVANPSVMGASAMVIPTEGRYNGNDTQRLWLKTQSSSEAEQHLTIDIQPVFNTNSSRGNMKLILTPELTAGDPSLTNSNQGVEVDLFVGPESTTIVSMKPSSASAEELGAIDLKRLYNIAKVVVPVVAKAGYEIYKELKTKKELEAKPELDSAGVGAILGSLLSVAKVAVPIAGTLLAALV